MCFYSFQAVVDTFAVSDICVIVINCCSSISMYVFKYVRMYVWMDGWMYVYVSLL